MSHANITGVRDATIILTDYTNYTPWLLQLKAKAEFHDIWAIADPDGTREPLLEPIPPVLPRLADYVPAVIQRPAPSASSTSRGHRVGSSSQTTRSNPPRTDATPAAPTKLSDLSPESQETYKADRDDYKVQLEAYKIDEKKYDRERANYRLLATHIQSTVSAHIQRNCCLPGTTIRQWITDIRRTVGINPLEERQRARTRYHNALKPMRTPVNWDIWLAEYDRAATAAETEGVAEVQHSDDIIEDFLSAVERVAPMWVTAFSSQVARGDPDHDRKEMMKLFREHMSRSYPQKGKQNSAFAAGDAAYPAGGESDQGAQRDASGVAEEASSALRGKNRGRTRGKRKFGQSSTRSKHSSLEDTAAVEGTKCHACEQRHNLFDCFYLNEDRAPAWFTPDSRIAKLVEYKRKYDPELIKLLDSKRQRSKTPLIKNSHTPTPEVIKD